MQRKNILVLFQRLQEFVDFYNSDVIIGQDGVASSRGLIPMDCKVKLDSSHSICYYDAMRFYTNAFVRGNYVYVRGYDYGKRFNEKVFYKPLSMNLQENNLDIKQSQDNM